jgi:hypothetical protein
MEKLQHFIAILMQYPILSPWNITRNKPSHTSKEATAGSIGTTKPNRQKTPGHRTKAEQDFRSLFRILCLGGARYQKMEHEGVVGSLYKIIYCIVCLCLSTNYGNRPEILWLKRVCSIFNGHNFGYPPFSWEDSDGDSKTIFTIDVQTLMEILSYHSCFTKAKLGSA